VNLFYREADPQYAPVVVLLHGFPDTALRYRAQITRLAELWA
jgi:pimeloyl-ACP methyl ester carboxylesterase